MRCSRAALSWRPAAAALLEAARNPKLAAGAPGRIVAARHPVARSAAVLDAPKATFMPRETRITRSTQSTRRPFANTLRGVFPQLDSSNSAAYRANLMRLNEQIDRKLVQWQKTLEPFRGQHVVAYHNSWPYFAQRFGVKVDLFLEPKPGLPLRRRISST